MEDNVQKLADAGQLEDSLIIHAAPGEMVVPPVISEQTQQMINQDMQSVGLNPAEYIVGQGSINNLTGLQEFGFLSKLFKKVKKVVKKVAPVAMFIPGVGTALGGVLGGTIGKIGSAVGLKGTVAKNVLGAIGKAGIPGISPLAGGATTGFSAIKTGLSSPFAGGLFGKKGSSFVGGPASGTGLQNRLGLGSGTPSQVASANQATAAQQQLNSLTPAQIANMNPQTLANLQQIASGGGRSNFASQLPLLGLAGLFGKVVKEDMEEKTGGLADIRQSVRPDLMPQPTFQGFDVGVRPGMSYGGALGYRPGFAMGNDVDIQTFMEQDMRMGGPSEGPGTETSDDIPAMLSDGEFVMTAAANKGLGGFKIEKNKDSLTIFPTGKPDREQGFKNNDKLMKFFENYQDMMS
jgi:hypothetical protein